MILNKIKTLNYKLFSYFYKVMNRFFMLLLAFLLVFILSACASKIRNKIQSHQKVTVESIPSGANIFMEGKLLGKTPMVLHLRSDTSHEIFLQKEGFKSISEHLDPIYKKDKKPYVQFGLAKDMGYYYKLSRDSVLSELYWEELPPSTGITPFESMGSLVSKADKAKLSGLINSEEHKIIMRQIIELYNLN